LRGEIPEEIIVAPRPRLELKNGSDALVMEGGQGNIEKRRS
jgi:hypothetical protein